MKRSTRRLLTICLGLLSMVLVCSGLYRAFTQVEHGEHFKTVRWLPAQATDVCFYRSYLFTAYEFDISEKGFLEWASRWEVKPITAPFEISRYGSRMAGHLYPDGVLSSRPTDDEVALYQRKLGEWQAFRRATITEGYCYEDMHSDGGGTWVAYDKKRGRAYYQSMPR